MFYLRNKNELIGRYPGAAGVEIGLTPKAGKCLVALAERDGSKALLVLLNAPNRWWDAETMLNEAFRRNSKRRTRAMRHLLPSLTIAGAAVLAYANSFGGVFQFDDFNVIVGNPAVHSWQAWLADVAHRGSGRS